MAIALTLLTLSPLASYLTLPAADRHGFLSADKQYSGSYINLNTTNFTAAEQDFVEIERLRTAPPESQQQQGRQAPPGWQAANEGPSSKAKYATWHEDADPEAETTFRSPCLAHIHLTDGLPQLRRLTLAGYRGLADAVVGRLCHTSPLLVALDLCVISPGSA